MRLPSLDPVVKRTVSFPGSLETQIEARMKELRLPSFSAYVKYIANQDMIRNNIPLPKAAIRAIEGRKKHKKAKR